MLLIVDFFVDALTIDGFWWAVLSAILITFVTAIGERIVLGSDGKFGDKK